ncbi:hypothetical protein [Falsirhodobacter sp. alg1]|uniref:hypothetical protein n=1 Tax=Falsirhodobacter sp. alg1 TaxID=1472418 RepID=UPI0005EEEC8C|nr:hypothetical protein [Falsirhodobacter sp. alg1]
MEWLVIGGAIVCVAGLGGLVMCILSALRAQREGLTGDALQERFRKLSLWNSSALGICALGLMAVITGLILS